MSPLSFCIQTINPDKTFIRGCGLFIHSQGFIDHAKNGIACMIHKQISAVGSMLFGIKNKNADQYHQINIYATFVCPKPI